MHPGQSHEEDREPVHEELGRLEAVESPRCTQQVQRVAEVQHEEAHDEEPVHRVGELRPFGEDVVQERRAVVEQRPRQPGRERGGDRHVHHVDHDHVLIRHRCSPPMSA